MYHQPRLAWVDRPNARSGPPCRQLRQTPRVPRLRQGRLRWRRRRCWCGFGLLASPGSCGRCSPRVLQLAFRRGGGNAQLTILRAGRTGGAGAGTPGALAASVLRSVRGRGSGSCTRRRRSGVGCGGCALVGCFAYRARTRRPQPASDGRRAPRHIWLPRLLRAGSGVRLGATAAGPAAAASTRLISASPRLQRPPSAPGRCG